MSHSSVVDMKLLTLAHWTAESSAASAEYSDCLLERSLAVARCWFAITKTRVAERMASAAVMPMSRMSAAPFWLLYLCIVFS